MCLCEYEHVCVLVCYVWNVVRYVGKRYFNSRQVNRYNNLIPTTRTHHNIDNPVIMTGSMSLHTLLYIYIYIYIYTTRVRTQNAE